MFFAQLLGVKGQQIALIANFTFSWIFFFNCSAVCECGGVDFDERTHSCWTCKHTLYYFSPSFSYSEKLHAKGSGTWGHGTSAQYYQQLLKICEIDEEKFQRNCEGTKQYQPMLNKAVCQEKEKLHLHICKEQLSRYKACLQMTGIFLYDCHSSLCDHMESVQLHHYSKPLSTWGRGVTLKERSECNPLLQVYSSPHNATFEWPFWEDNPT